MEHVPTTKATRRIGPPASWDHASGGICHTLDVVDRDGWMITTWRPTAAELGRLNAGEAVLLWIRGKTHPVVRLTVGPSERATKERR